MTQPYDTIRCDTLHVYLYLHAPKSGRIDSLICRTEQKKSNEESKKLKTDMLRRNVQS